MEREFLRALRDGKPLEGFLERAGDPEPAAAARAFERARGHADLAPQVDRWAGVLLRSARPGFGVQCLEELATRHREVRESRLDLAPLPWLPPLLGASNFLARLLVRSPGWVADLLGDPPPPLPGDPEPDWHAIRVFKYRGLARIAARDLAGRSFAESPGELSDLADRCLRVALGLSAEESGVEAPVLFALGKLGGCELNFSSDVDLLFVYETPSGEDDLAHNHAVARVVQRLKAGLESPSPVGFAYRVDLDLRPEGKVGVLANSVEAALAYYESFGAEWERQALLRLRYVAGPEATARRFEGGVQPFVYRRAIGADVLRAVHDMKTRIEGERRRAGKDIDRNLKEGWGGIRDVEFLVQALQLLYAGRDPRLRTGNVLQGLEALAGVGALPEDVVTGLRDAYLWLRRAEHAIQLAEERQTHHFPEKPSDQIALARRMGYGEDEGARARARLLDDWTAVRTQVRSEFEALVLGDVR